MFVKRVDYIVIQSHRISRLASLSMKIRILQPYIAFKINIMDSNSLNQQIMNVYAILKQYFLAAPDSYFGQKLFACAKEVKRENI